MQPLSKAFLRFVPKSLLLPLLLLLSFAVCCAVLLQVLPVVRTVLGTLGASHHELIKSVLTFLASLTVSHTTPRPLVTSHSRSVALLLPLLCVSGAASGSHCAGYTGCQPP